MEEKQVLHALSARGAKISDMDMPQSTQCRETRTTFSEGRAEGGARRGGTGARDVYTYYAFALAYHTAGVGREGREGVVPRAKTRKPRLTNAQKGKCGQETADGEFGKREKNASRSFLEMVGSDRCCCITLLSPRLLSTRARPPQEVQRSQHPCATAALRCTYEADGSCGLFLRLFRLR